MNLIKKIPSIISSGNIFCGALATTFAFSGEINYSVGLIIIAAILDFLDGFFARLLNAVSEFGKQIDSLADLVSFGMAPSAIIYYFLLNTDSFNQYSASFAFIILIFAAIRLSIFNIDDSQENEFYGLPSPAMALVVISFAWHANNNAGEISDLIKHELFLSLLVVFLSAFMLIRIKLFSLKVKSLDLNKYLWQFIFLILSCILLIIFRVFGLSLIIFLYIAMSILKNIITKNNKNEVLSRN